MTEKQTTAISKSNAGRKSKYMTHVQDRLGEIEQWCKDGLIEKEIVRKLGVSMAAFSSYKLEFKELVEALKLGKMVADNAVEDSLYKLAMGYEYEEHSIVEEAVGNKGKLVVRTTTIFKQVQPSVTAQIFWLKNRRPQDWRDVKDFNINADVSFSVKKPAAGLEGLN